MVFFTSPDEESRKMKRMRGKVQREKRHRKQHWNIGIENITEKSASVNIGILKLTNYPNM